MARSEQFEQAVETMVAMCCIPSLADGFVRFEPDLSGGRWYEDDRRAHGPTGMGVVAELYDDRAADEETRRTYCQASLAAALTYQAESLPLMVRAAEEWGRPEHAAEYRELIAGYERHLNGSAEVRDLRAVGVS